MSFKYALAAAAASTLAVASPATAATIVLDGSGFRIPPARDGTGPGDSSSSVIAESGQGAVTGLVLTLFNLRHDEVGDLQFLLSHGSTEVLFANFFGAREDDDPEGDADLDGTYRIFDGASTVFQIAPGDPIPSGDYRPNAANAFANFNGMGSGGEWTLTVRDRLATDSGRLGSWQLEITTNRIVAAVPEPATWAMMVLGFGLAGAAMRHRRSVQARLAF